MPDLIYMRKELLKTRAYLLYLSELKVHLEFAKLKIINNEVISEQTCKAARGIFHTLKGSSGFFGFDEISAKSDALEKLFTLKLEDLVCHMSEVRNLISEIDICSQNLPASQFNENEVENA